VSPDSALNIPSSPVSIVGTVSLLLAYLIAAWSVTAGIAGNARKSRALVRSSVWALHGFTAVAAVASALIIYAFVTHDYSIKYVALTSDTSMPISYKITAFWGGLDGSLLFWVMVLAGFSSVAIAVNHRRHRDMIGYVVATIMVVQLFFLTLLVFNKNPFATYLTGAPVDGQGLNPLLQNYWMVIHPPSLYIGYVAATIPFAFGMGALASGRLDDLWLSSVRSWMLVCFFFLSFGLILGGRWAYEELGWGGYWAWDPVENAGLLPWFTATAFLHSVIIQEQRGMMKSWNLFLVIATFFLTIFGTFMTRSGVVQSVHAFGEDSVLALQFVVFMLFILVVSLGLLIYRGNKLGSTNSFESFWSREFAFLVNNWILLACAVFVWFVTMFPTITEAFSGDRVSVKPEFFNQWMTPLGLTLLFLAGAAPLLAWRRTTRARLYDQFLIPAAFTVVSVGAMAALWPATRVRTTIFAETVQLPVPLVNFAIIAFVLASIGQEFWRGVSVRRKQTGSDPITSLVGLVLNKRRKYGGYVIHVGVALMFIGFSGRAWERMEDRTIEVPEAVLKERGQPVTQAHFDVDGYTFRYEDLTQVADDHKVAVTATVSLWRGNDKLNDLHPARWDFRKGEQPTTEVDIHERLHEDVYIVLTGFDLEKRLANFRIYINPLINWVWLGFVLLGLGTFICLVPQKVVDAMAPAPRNRTGKVLDAAILIGAVLLSLLVSVEAARAEKPAELAAGAVLVVAQGGPVEHADEATTRPGHDDGTGHAHQNRPNSATADKLMRELICLCGGCKRENLHQCKCGYAAQERGKVLGLLADQDLSTSDGRKKAEEVVIAAFVQEYGGEHVLGTPRSAWAWLLPYVIWIGGLGLLFAIGVSWVRRGRAQMAAAPAAPAEDDELAERLDDELRNTD
jgi:cytochrome c-type biogenesis protein CcmF